MKVRIIAVIVLFLFLVMAAVAFAEEPEICKAAHDGDLSRVKALLKQDPSLIRAQCDDGQTPLHMAARKGQINVADYLLSKKANINACAKDGETPLHKAAKHNEKNMVQYLLKKKAQVNPRDDKGETPLTKAKKRGLTPIVNLLREYGGVE